MTPLGENVLKVIKEKGWLAVNYLTFDNSINCNVFHSGGRVAICEATNSAYWLAVNDTSNSMKIENTLISTDYHQIAQQATLIEQDMDCLQHVTYALYGHPKFFNQTDSDPIPYPEYPKPDFLKSLTKDKETGLYVGAPGMIVYGPNGASDEETKVSAIPLYEKFDPEVLKYDSHAVVSEWKTFYEVHERFIDMIEEFFGISGCV